MNLALELTHCPLDFGMAGMTNKNDDASLVDIALALKVHSCDKRADCVQDRQATRLGIILDGARHSVRAENRHCARRNFGKVLHEARALGLEALHHVPVMDDLMAHINRRSELFERTLHNLDGSDNSGTESPRLCQYDFHRSNIPEPISRLPWNAVKMLLCHLNFCELEPRDSAAWLECGYLGRHQFQSNREG